MSAGKLTIQATVESVATRADKTLKVVLGTQELNHDVMAALMSLHQVTVNVAMSIGQLTEEDTDKLDAPVPLAGGKVKQKTPSQRLRAVLYVYWERQGGGVGFETFYAQKMEQIIETYKSRID